MEEIAQKAIENMLNEIGNAHCLNELEIDNAGLLEFYMSLVTEETGRARLRRTYTDNADAMFVLDNRFDLQIGAVLVDTATADREEYGGFDQVNNLQFRVDLILIIHNENVTLKIQELIRAFSETAYFILEHVEPNPLSVLARHALIPPKDFIGYPVQLRAYAFTFLSSQFIY